MGKGATVEVLIGGPRDSVAARVFAAAVEPQSAAVANQHNS